MRPYAALTALLLAACAVDDASPPEAPSPDPVAEPAPPPAVTPPPAPPAVVEPPPRAVNANGVPFLAACRESDVPGVARKARIDGDVLTVVGACDLCLALGIQESRPPRARIVPVAGTCDPGFARIDLSPIAASRAPFLWIDVEGANSVVYEADQP